MKNQLSVFEKEVVDETASAVSQHIFNADFTIHGAENTKLKTAFLIHTEQKQTDRLYQMLQMARERSLFTARA